jgi:transcriptional regulator with XRE-family HTH domain
MRDEFPTLLRGFRERNGRSRNALAHEVGVDPSYLTRIEHGDREPPRQHIVEALTRALRLSVPERNRLLVAAGYAPLSVVQLGAWDDALQSVTDVLNDIELTEAERNEFRSVVRLISERWRGTPIPDLNPRLSV